MPEKNKVVVLLSGGLDSTTLLALAANEGHPCYTLSFDYGQRHRTELLAAQRLSASMGAEGHKVIRLDLGTVGGSALTDLLIDVPEAPEAGIPVAGIPVAGIPVAGIPVAGIPVTYVPARNTVFLSLALGWAEVLGARDIFIGVNAVDYSGYPDCRPAFIEAFQQMANLATRAGVEGHAIEIRTPLMEMTKADIIRRGQALGVDYGLTISCYQADSDGRACGRCDSCRLRREGFTQAGVADPTRYQE